MTDPIREEFEAWVKSRNVVCNGELYIDKDPLAAYRAGRQAGVAAERERQSDLDLGDEFAQELGHQVVKLVQDFCSRSKEYFSRGRVDG